MKTDNHNPRPNTPAACYPALNSVTHPAVGMFVRRMGCRDSKTETEQTPQRKVSLETSAAARAIEISRLGERHFHRVVEGRAPAGADGGLVLAAQQ